MEQRMITITVKRPVPAEPERTRAEVERQRMLRKADAWYNTCVWLVLLIALGFILAGIIHERANLAKHADANVGGAVAGATYHVVDLAQVLPSATPDDGRLPGDDIPATEYATYQPEESRYGYVSSEDRELIARLVWLEARGEPAEGKQAVAEVVLNRRAADNFPDTVYDVIYQNFGQKGQQFTPAGLIDEAWPTDAEYAAVEQAIHGEYILPLDVVYFSTKGENDRVWGQIGGHVFCYQYIWE